ncbi:MAG: DUF1513 domain-containing protein [Lentilitoribacter sp.]
MTRLELDRRAFLLGVGASISTSILPTGVGAKAFKDDVIFASGFREKDGSFGLALLSETGDILYKHKLPERGHGLASNLRSQWAIIFARRPGNFALAFDPNNAKEPRLFTTPTNRHFYGHGVFSTNGKLLFASENDFDKGDGIIGIYDGSDGFNRIGEFSSGGIGPHEIIMLPDGKTLCVANGGIKTHPQFPRTKLNLETMRSNIAFIDAVSGAIKEVHQLPTTWSLLSMRHMASDRNGNVWLGGQYEGNAFDQAPLIAKVSFGNSLEFINLPAKQMIGFKNYIGSVSINDDEGVVALSSPKGGQVLVLNSVNGDIIQSHFDEGVCGLAPLQNKFVKSSENGRFGSIQHPYNWDNHIGLI